MLPSDAAVGVSVCAAGVPDSMKSVCCAKACGTCGGAECKARGGGEVDCCVSALKAANHACATPTDTSCVLAAAVTEAVTVRIGGQACAPVFVSHDAGTATCAVPHLEAGAHAVEVVGAVGGRATFAAGVSATRTYAGVVDSVTDAHTGNTNVPVAGGNMIAVRGTGFAALCSQNTVTIAGRECACVSATHSEIRCLSPGAGEAASAWWGYDLDRPAATVEVAGAVNHTFPNHLTWDWTLTPSYSSITPSAWSAAVTTPISLAGDFGGYAERVDCKHTLEFVSAGHGKATPECGQVLSGFYTEIKRVGVKLEGRGGAPKPVHRLRIGGVDAFIKPNLAACKRLCTGYVPGSDGAECRAIAYKKDVTKCILSKVSLDDVATVDTAGGSGYYVDYDRDSERVCTLADAAEAQGVRAHACGELRVGSGAATCIAPRWGATPDTAAQRKTTPRLKLCSAAAGSAFAVPRSSLAPAAVDVALRVTSVAPASGSLAGGTVSAVPMVPNNFFSFVNEGGPCGGSV